MKQITILFILFSGILLFPKLGQALSFDGSNDYVIVGDSNSLDLINNFTISAWINTNTINDITHRIIHKNSAYTFYIDSASSRLGIYHYGTTVYAYSSDNSLSAGAYYHVVYVQSSVNGVAFYINGIAKGGNSAYTGNVPTNVNPINIGLDEDLVSFPFNGLIDEVRVYNRVLSASEIRGLYGGWNIRNGLVGYWRLLGTSLVFEPDWSGLKNHGKATNGPVRSALSRVLRFRR